MSEWLDIITLPLSFGFMQRALAISVLVGAVCAVLSCYLVLKGWSLMGDAISHAVFPGVVIAYIVGWPFAVGAFIAGMLAAVATGYLADNSRVKRDTAMGVVFSGMFGLGLLLYVAIQSDVHLDHILFGDILGIGPADLTLAGIIALISAGAIALKWRDLLLHAFDPTQARAVGLPVGLLHYGLLCLITLTIVGALTSVGIILSVALLIAPGAIAHLLTRRFGAMLGLAMLVAVLASFFGVYLSFFIDSAPAPTIVLLLSLFFIAAFVWSSVKARTSDAAAA